VVFCMQNCGINDINGKTVTFHIDGGT